MKPSITYHANFGKPIWIQMYPGQEKQCFTIEAATALKDALVDVLERVKPVPPNTCDLVKTIQKAQVHAGEQAVIANLKALGFEIKGE